MDNADIGFVIDGSGSIRDANPSDGSFDNWQLLLNFVGIIIDNLPEIGIRVGAVIFSDRGQLLFDFDDFLQNRSAARDFLLTTRYPGANTNTSGGLYVARSSLFMSRNSDRMEFAIVITDGKSTFDSDKTLPIAEDLKNDGVEIISVGITNSVDLTEIKGISSIPQIFGQNYYTSEDFQQLEEVAFSILSRICVAPPTNSGIE